MRISLFPVFQRFVVAKNIVKYCISSGVFSPVPGQGCIFLGFLQGKVANNSICNDKTPTVTPPSYTQCQQNFKSNWVFFFGRKNEHKDKLAVWDFNVFCNCWAWVNAVLDKHLCVYLLPLEWHSLHINCLDWCGHCMYKATFHHNHNVLDQRIRTHATPQKCLTKQHQVVWWQLGQWKPETFDQAS